MMVTSVVASLSMLWVLPCFSQAPSASGTRTAAVEVRAVDSFGRPLAGTKVDSFVDTGGRELAGLFSGGAHARGVPLRGSTAFLFTPKDPTLNRSLMQRLRQQRSLLPKVLSGVALRTTAVAVG